MVGLLPSRSCGYRRCSFFAVGGLSAGRCGPRGGIPGERHADALRYGAADTKNAVCGYAAKFLSAARGCPEVLQTQKRPCGRSVGLLLSRSCGSPCRCRPGSFFASGRRLSAGRCGPRGGIPGERHVDALRYGAADTKNAVCGYAAKFLRAACGPRLIWKVLQTQKRRLRAPRKRTSGAHGAKRHFLIAYFGYRKTFRLSASAVRCPAALLPGRRALPDRAISGGIRFQRNT